MILEEFIRVISEFRANINREILEIWLNEEDFITLFKETSTKAKYTDSKYDEITRQNILTLFGIYIKTLNKIPRCCMDVTTKCGQNYRLYTLNENELMIKNIIE